MNFGVIWKSDWFAGTIITLLFLVASQFNMPPLSTLENHVYDLAATKSETKSDANIIIVSLDEEALKHSGNYQPQPAMASVIQTLSDAGARAIGMDILFRSPEQADPAVATTTLPEAVRHSGNTLMPMLMETGSSGEFSNIVLPNHIQRLVIPADSSSGNSSSSLRAVNLWYPYAALSQSAAGLGHMSIFRDSDGVVRTEPLVVEYSGYYLPSLSLAMAAQALHVPLGDIRINPAKSIELGALDIITDPSQRIYPTFFRNSNGNRFSTVKFSDILAGTLPAEMFRNKLVLIGSSSVTFATPVSERMSRVEFSAQVLQSILNDSFFSRPAWVKVVEPMLLLLIGLYLVLLLPRLNVTVGLIATGLLTVACISTGFTLLIAYGLWVQTMAAALLLLLGQLLLWLQMTNAGKESVKLKTTNLHETNKMLGFSFQSQGMLDKAFEKFLACPVDEEMLSILYELAHAFERKRQFKQAIAVYNHIAGHNPVYKDIQTRLITATNAHKALSDKDSSLGLSTLLITGESRPTLGRYEILSELGKGAMGTVYLGKDPKINRQVAIKTMALSQEFEPDELEEVKTKFFHEAEIAGMLNHQNIVTIFDAGDEHDLAYIAMEFLDGIDLVPYTKKGKTLPVTTTLKIVAKVAEALQYAHDHGVIHRDIKPANIMILKNKTVKVTDFGIAHINESSKTKAGVVLGTPSYMSPEQLSGKELDGRSDLFSMGVMLYELVSGVRPFRGDSISKLMFKIAKEPHADIREHNPDVPDCVRLLIDSMLAKKVDLRIETASDVLEGVQRCLRELRSQEAG